jgi:hypothetical protein
MAVDAKRLQAVFEAALEAADPGQQAAILDRECGSDADFRRRVETLLKEEEEATSVTERLPGAPDKPPPLPSDATMRSDPPTDDEGMTTVRSSRDQEPAHTGAGKDTSEILLGILQPSTMPGSFGRLGHHDVLEILGRGAFGIVARAFDEKLQRVVAIKVLAPHLAATSPARKRFLREARASGKVRHENVVQIHAVEEEPIPYLVMEFIPGQTLQQKLDSSGPLDAKEVLRIGEQIARGLAAAHAQGLIHRDIKPGNILLENGPEPKVKITDFGLARAADDASLTQSGVIAGTPLYMAPEQAKGDTLDARSDLFSLGSVLYAMASGRPPFRAATPLAVLKRVADDTPRPIRDVVPETPQWLCDLIARLQAKDPAQRFQSAAEVADLFRQHLAYLEHPSQVARPYIAAPGAQRHQRQIVVVGVAVLVIALLGIVLTHGPFWGTARPTPEKPGSTGGESSSTVASATDERPATGEITSHVLQGGAAVSGALIDFSEPDRRFGSEAYSNAVRRAEEQCSAFLVRFDLEKLNLPPKSRVVEATVSFYVWDPSSFGKTKVCAIPMKTAWDSETVTWHAPAAGKTWQERAGFAFGSDTGAPGSSVVVKPEEGSDTADPPLEYQLDVTDLVRAWVAGETPNHGLAIAPVIDPTVDEGLLSRFQIFGTQHGNAKYTPKLTVQTRP